MGRFGKKEGRSQTPRGSVAKKLKPCPCRRKKRGCTLTENLRERKKKKKKKGLRGGDGKEDYAARGRRTPRQFLNTERGGATERKNKVKKGHRSLTGKWDKRESNVRGRREYHREGGAQGDRFRIPLRVRKKGARGGKRNGRVTTKRRIGRTQQRRSLRGNWKKRGDTEGKPWTKSHDKKHTKKTPALLRGGGENIKVLGGGGASQK